MTEFKRSLGLFDAVMLVSGSMIGSGIFIVSADMSKHLGASGWLLLAWVVTGLLTVLAALSYGELAGMMPKAGGQYVYIQRSFGPLMSFLYGWTVFSVIQTGVIAAVAMAFAKFTAVFFPALDATHVLFSFAFIKINSSQAFAIASIVLLTYLNTKGIQNGKVLQTIFTITKILAIIALICFGIYFGWGESILEINLQNAWLATESKEVLGEVVTIPLHDFALVSAFGVAMIGSLFSSDAWNNVTFIAGEIKQPQRNIPLSLFIGTLIVISLYVLVNVSYLMLLPLQEIQSAPQQRVATLAAGKIFGNQSEFLMAGLIMISTFGCNNGIILAGSRLFYAMAIDGLFFKKAAHLNRHSVPGFALWSQCIWACVLCLSGHYGDLLEYTTFASLLFYIATIAGLFVLRQKEPLAERPYKAFGYPIIPGLYIFFALAICINLLIASPVYTLAGLGIVSLGFPIYYLHKKTHN